MSRPIYKWYLFKRYCSCWFSDEDIVPKALWHDLVHWGQSHFFSKLRYLPSRIGAYFKKYWSKLQLHSLFLDQVTNFWPVIIVLFSFIFLPQFWPVSQLWKCRLWPQWTISCHNYKKNNLICNDSVLPTSLAIYFTILFISKFMNVQICHGWRMAVSTWMSMFEKSCTDTSIPG